MGSGSRSGAIGVVAATRDDASKREVFLDLRLFVSGFQRDMQLSSYTYEQVGSAM